MTDQRPLFREGDLQGTLDARRNTMLREIDSYDSDRLLNTSPTDLAEYFASKFRIEPVEILRDSITVSQSETSVDARGLHDRVVVDHSRPVPIPAIVVTLDVPFSGDPIILRCRGSTFGTVLPRAHLTGQRLLISVTRTHHDGDSIRRHLDRELDLIERNLGWNAQLVHPYNNSLEENALRRITHRRERLLANRNLVANLGFPLSQRSDVTTYTPPEVRKRVTTRPPPSSNAAYVPEPALAMKDYEHILELMLATARSLERSPSTFAAMGEESLRDQFLIVLNTHYEGQATAETFNAGGKTDILVRSKDRNVFICECKIWRGAKALLDAVDQLLSYTTWRDTKTALVVFNRNRNVSQVIAKVPPTISRHPEFKRQLQTTLEGAYRCILSHRDDPNRELVLTVLVVDVPRRAA